MFGRAVVDRYGQPGVRQTRWIQGRYQLTVDDVRAGRRFDDRVARCAWGIELHNSPSDVHWEGFPDGHVHYVPYRSMVHAEVRQPARGRPLHRRRPARPRVGPGDGAVHRDGRRRGARGRSRRGQPLPTVDIGALRRRLARNLGDA